jgi:hypothetical protein
MKKILSILWILGVLVACNSSGSGSESVKDSILENIDSTGDAKIDSVKEAIDSTKERVENKFEKTDSANKALADSLDKK